MINHINVLKKYRIFKAVLERIQIKHLLLLFVITFMQSFENGATAQEKNTEKPGLKISGFVKSDFWIDSRLIDGAREDLLLYYPQKIVRDKNGNDINDKMTTNFSAIKTRINLTAKGPDAFGAKTTAVIEADFTGTNNADINGLRLRHAFAKMRWEKSELLMGQFWHPMFVPEVFPDVMSLNTGAPFQPFIRNPQISYTRFLGKFNLQAALIEQRDNNSDGPFGRSNQYMRNALIPNSHLQLQYKNGAHIAGVAIDHKVLQPRLVTDSLRITNEKIQSASGMIYYKYKKDKLTVRFKGIYGQNLNEHLMLGGYAVKTIHPITRYETYTNTNHIFTWAGLQYGEKIQYSLFAGFAKNLGTSDQNAGIYYAKGKDIDYMYRVSPSVYFNSGPMRIAFEFEYTVAAFGVPNNMGKVLNTEEVGVLRALTAVSYFF